MSSETSWRELIDAAKSRRGDTSDTVAVHPADIDLDKRFYDGYGGPEGEPFVLWTEEYVYFPIVYDGAEWVGGVPREPKTDIKPVHFGGW